MKTNNKNICHQCGTDVFMPRNKMFTQTTLLIFLSLSTIIYVLSSFFIKQHLPSYIYYNLILIPLIFINFLITYYIKSFLFKYSGEIRIFKISLEHTHEFLIELEIKSILLDEKDYIIKKCENYNDLIQEIDSIKNKCNNIIIYTSKEIEKELGELIK